MINTETMFEKWNTLYAEKIREYLKPTDKQIEALENFGYTIKDNLDKFDCIRLLEGFIASAEFEASEYYFSMGMEGLVQ